MVYDGLASISRCKRLCRNQVIEVDQLHKKQRFLIGTSLIRIIFSLLILYFYLINYSNRHFLWGPQGVITFEQFIQHVRIPSLYHISPEIWYFELVYHLGIVISLLYLIGFKGRITGVLNFVFFWSLLVRNEVILDSGEYLLRIVAFYLLFANTTGYLSYDHWRRKGRYQESKKNKDVVQGLFISLHNISVFACLLQLCVVYLTSFFYKSLGYNWLNGTAIENILQVDMVSHPEFKAILLHYPELLKWFTFGSYFFQLLFVLMILNRFTRIPAFLISVSMHLGIAMIMGLYSFSFTMIALDLLLIGDDGYRKFYRRISSFIQLAEKAYLDEKRKRNLGW